MTPTIPEFLAMIVSLLAAGTAIYNALTTRDASVSGAWREMLEPLRGRVKELEMQQDAHDKEIAELRRELKLRDTRILELEQIQGLHENGIQRLAAQVVSLGGQPVYVSQGRKS